MAANIRSMFILGSPCAGTVDRLDGRRIASAAAGSSGVSMLKKGLPHGRTRCGKGRRESGQRTADAANIGRDDLAVPWQIPKGIVGHPDAFAKHSVKYAEDPIDDPVAPTRRKALFFS
jgi:hypothetical protein